MLKKIIIFLLFTGSARFLYQWYQQNSADARNPEVIANPVYTEVHVNMGVQDRSFDQVILVKTVDEPDCKKMRSDLESTFGAVASKLGQRWEVRSSDCKTELEPRYARLFENQPTFLTYLSMARGNKREREVRMITWGITVEESNKLCEGMSQAQRPRHKGAVTCIRAA